MLYHLLADRAKIGKTPKPLKLGVKMKTDKNKKDDVAITSRSCTSGRDRGRPLGHMAALVATPSPQLPAPRRERLRPTPLRHQSSSPRASGPNTEYESAQIESRNESFPVHLRVGAEETLARMVYENENVPSL